MSSSTTSDDHAYTWEEKDWFEAREYPGYRDSEEAAARADIGEGDDWGQSHDFQTGVSKWQWLAKKILVQTGRVLCATTLYDPPDRGFQPHLNAEGIDSAPNHDPTAMHHQNEERELSEPELRVPYAASDQWGGVDYGQSRYRRRLQADSGYISGGASTGCVVADRPHDAFMHVIETILPLTNLTPRQQREVRAWMSEEKRHGDDRDIDLLEQFLAVALTADSDTTAN